MSSPSVTLIGFDKDDQLSEVFVQFGLFKDYKAMLPELLLGILREQHPDVVVDTIELLDVPDCKLGGLQPEGADTLITVQTLDVPLDLRVAVRVGRTRLALDVQLVIKCEGLDATPTTSADLFVKAQRQL